MSERISDKKLNRLTTKILVSMHEETTDKELKKRIDKALELRNQTNNVKSRYKIKGKK